MGDPWKNLGGALGILAENPADVPPREGKPFGWGCANSTKKWNALSCNSTQKCDFLGKIATAILAELLAESNQKRLIHLSGFLHISIVLSGIARGSVGDILRFIGVCVCKFPSIVHNITTYQHAPDHLYGYGSAVPSFCREAKATISTPRAT